MPFKKNKLYEKKMVVGMRKTKDRIAEKFLRGKKRSNENASEFYGGSDEEANQWEDVEQKKKDDMAKPGARKHTHDKDVPGLHPNLAQDAHKKPKETRIIPKKQLRSIQGRLNELRAKKSAPIVTNSEALPLDHGRSAGNVSIRNVLATFRMKNKQPLSLYYRIKPIALPRVIKLIARFGLLWEMVMYLMIVMTFCAISFSAFFAFFEQEIWNLIEITDYVFALDTIVRLSVEIWRYRNRASVVVYTAPYTFLQFCLDAVSMVPIHQIYFWFEGPELLSELSEVDFFRFNRFCRLYSIFQLFEILQTERVGDEKALYLFKFTNYYLFFIYFTGCGLAHTIGMKPIDYLLYHKVDLLEKSYLRNYQEKKPGYGSTPWDIFVITINFATAVVTTVGYGDVTPTNEFEMSICIVCMLVGAIFLNGYFTSQLTNFVVELDGARFDLFYRLREIRRYLASLKTLPFFNAKVEEYYKYLWTYREGVFDVRFMQQFTKTFHEELLFNTCKEMFDKSQLFYKMDATFLRSISKVVEVALYNPNMILCRKGNYANKMYYILQGECQAMSKLNRANASAVIRAGSIVGEANLFFSFPYTTTVETRTCCQFIILHKKHLLPLLDQYKTELETLRSRSLNKIKEVYDTHQSYGENPILWVKAKTDMENPSYPNADKLRRNMRWGSGLNKEVLEDVVDDSHETVIFETPCSDQSVLKNHLTPYMTCVVPEIMNSEMKWIKLWNFFIMSIAVWYAFFGPFCLVFGESTKLEHYVCTAQNFASGVISLIFLVDVFVEIMGACPVKGYYYQFWNGLKVVTHQPPFYLDCLAALPLYFVNYEIQSVLQIAATLLKVTKLWKVIRFLHYLDNVNPMRLLLYRLAQTIIVLLYGIHFMSCISYFVACPYNHVKRSVDCQQTSWLASYEVQWRSSNDPFDKMPNFMKLNTLGYGSPYLYSFFYSAATLTSAGFGDFNPQNRTEMLWAIGFQLFGFYLIGYYTAVLTSALSCVMRPKVALQQQLVSLCQFMNHYHLREHLKDRVIEYFVLQHQLRGGVSLDNYGAIMYDAPEYMRNDVLYLEVCDLLEGVPIFSKVEADAIISLSQAMTRFIIPPDTTFLQKGEVRRILYVIKSGSMGVYDDEKCHEPVSILEPSCHFGVRDLLFGEPSHYIIRSLSYVCMYSIKHTQFKNLFNDHDDEFGDLIGQEKQRTKHVIREMTVMYSKMAKNVPNPDKPTRIPSWVVIPPRVDATATKVLGQVDPKHIAMVHLLNDEYEDLFRKFKYSGFLRKFLLRKTIHPAGNFSKSWNCVMSLVCCFTVTTLMLETFCYMRMPWFRVFQSHLDWVNYVDIYLKLHWSYYNPYNGVMITHPLKTATNYILHGSLVMDVAICAPLELIIWALGLTDTWGYGRSATWYSRLRWIRFFQFKRIPIVFHIVHNTFKHRGIILLTLYVTLTVFVCTIVSAIALYIACPWEGNVWKEGDQYRLPICMKNSWPANKYKDLDTNPAVISTVLRRWVLGVYYVSQVILVIGFGDMITLEKSDIVLLVFMCVFGFIFMRCVIADMTAAEVDSDEARANFVENMIVLDLVMKREKVPSRVSSSVMSHLRYTWSRSRGLQPRELFGDLHPVLESELYRNLVGEQLKKVPIFHSFSPTVLRSLCSYMKKLYILRGERIMRFGNLEYEMCIILAGKVLIADQHLNYVCSLGPGESFGECSMIYGSARRHNAIAACNTELYILSSYNFQNFLERYPNFKSNFKKNMASGKRDYFEKILDRKMEKAKGLSKEKKKEMLDTFAQRSRAVKDLVGQKEDLEEEGLDYKSNRNRFFGYGQLDDNLPLIYIAEPQMRIHTTDGKKCCGRKCCSCGKCCRKMRSLVIHPNSPLVKYFLVLITWLSYFTPAIAAYEICFSRGILKLEKSSGIESDSFIVSETLHKLSDVIEGIFLYNIFLQFFLAYEVRPGVYNKSQHCIILRYVTSLDSFLMDIIASLPFIIEKIMDSNRAQFEHLSQSTIIENLYLLRFIRLYHYFKYQTSRKDDLNISIFRYKITLSVTSFCLMAHMLACIFYWISPCLRPDLTNKTFRFLNLCPPPNTGLDRNGWTTKFVETNHIQIDKVQLSAWRWWFRSLYVLHCIGYTKITNSARVVTTISTTGFGDIVPVTIKEMAVGIFCIFCGAFILSMILSQFTSGMGSLTRTKREYMYQVLLLLKYLRNIGLSTNRQYQVMMYFLNMWERCRGVSYHMSWHTLPVSMQIEVAYALFGSTLNSVPYFQDTQEKIFIRQLSSRVTHSFYIPGTFVQYEGDIGTSLFVVYKGLVSGTQKLKNVKKGELDTELKEIFNPGDAFGRSAALFHDGLYKQSYRAETMVEILEVKQKDIVHLAQKFPRIKKRILNYINSKYGDRRDVGTNIFQRKRRKAEAFGPGADILFMTATRSQRVFPKLEEEPEDEYPNPLKKYEPAPPTPPPPPPKMFDQMVQVDLPPDRNKKRKSKDHEESKVNPIRRNPVAIPPPEKSNQTISEDDNASSRSSSTSTSESPTFKKSMQNDEVAYRRSSNVTPKRASKDVTRGKKYETKRNSRDVDNGIGTRKPRHSNESKKDKRRSSDDSKKNKRRPSNDNKQDKRRPSDDNKQYKRRPSDDNKQYKRRPSDDNKQEKRRSSNDNKQDKRRPSDDNKQGNRRRSSEGSDQPRRGSRRRSSTKKRRSSGGTDDEPRRRRRSSQRKSVDENNKQDGEWWPWF